VAQILASGVAMPEALRAADMLAAEWDVAADVWSVTSWGELNRDGVAVDRTCCAIRNVPPRSRTSRRRSATPPVPCGGVGLDARGSRADPAVGAQHVRNAGDGRLRVL